MFVIRNMSACDLLKLGLALAFLPATFPDSSWAQNADGVRSITREWVAVEQAISREKIDAERKRILTTDRIAVLEAERARLTEELAANNSLTTQSDTDRKALVTRQTGMAGRHEQVSSFLIEAEARVQAMKGRLPAVLRDQLASLYQRLEQPDLGVAQRLQTVIGILSNIQTFDASVTVQEENIVIGENTKITATTLYFGVGQAYFMSAKQAGYGYPEKDTWTWIPNIDDPSLKDRIARAIAMAQGRSAAPAYIDLQVTLAPEVAK